jgi:hypothetical protein
MKQPKIKPQNQLFSLILWAQSAHFMQQEKIILVKEIQNNLAWMLGRRGTAARGIRKCEVLWCKYKLT